MRRSTTFILPLLFLLSACSASVVQEPAALDGDIPAADTRVIALEARSAEFVPPVIRAKMGEKVVLQIMSVDGAHTFRSETLAIPFQPLPEGKQVLVTLPTDTRGTFTFDSGPINVDMQGTIVIE